MDKLTRRKFLLGGAKAALIGLACTAGIGESIFATAQGAEAAAGGEWTGEWDKHQWAFVVDTTKCIGCGKCVQACKTENNVPVDKSVYRTWVERYRIAADETASVDSPEGGIHGFTKEPADVDVEKAFFTPKLCNQCTKAPCVKVCPVGASYKTEDGVVLIDRKRCIGCAYCVQACPYGARFMHPELHVADKCTWCYHRITKGMKPACVQVCPTGARIFDDLKAPANKVGQILEKKRVNVLKPAMGTEPQVYYIGLDKVVN